MTSNLGAREGATKAIGFGENEYNIRAVTDAINNFFAPEFRNRLDGIVQFNSEEKNQKTWLVLLQNSLNRLRVMWKVVK